MQKYSGDWQEANTTTSKRATRAITAVLAMCGLLIATLIIRLSISQSSQSPTAEPPLRSVAMTKGVLQVINLPTTATPIVVVFEDVTATSLLQTPSVAQDVEFATPVSAEPTAIIIASVSPLVGAAINIRSGPGLGYSVVAVIQPNQQAQVLAQSRDGNWWQVDFAGKLGWLRKDIVQFRGDKNAVPIVDTVIPTPTP